MKTETGHNAPRTKEVDQTKVRPNRLAWPIKRGYNNRMTTKDIAIKTIRELPDSATWEDIEERVRFLSAIDKGLADVRAGKVVAHEEVKESLKKWLAG